MQTELAPIRPKGFTRWFTRHALGRLALQTGLRRGEIYPRLVLDDSLRDNPYPFYAKIREQGELVPGNFAFATARHAMVNDLLKHPDLRSGMPLESAPKPMRTLMEWAMEPEVLSPVDPPSMLVTDGPGHAKARKAVSRAFTPRAIADLDGRVQEIAEELLDEMDRRGPNVDLVLDYAEVLPVRVIAEILGVPVAMMPTFRGWGHDLAVSLDFGRNYATMRRAESAMRAMNAWFRHHFAALLRNPGEDLLSRMIVAADADRDPLTEIELVSIAGLVLAAGFETTVNLMGNGSALLFAHPEQLEDLRGRPEGWRNAIEEMLRFDPPAQNTVRHTAMDLEIAGHRVPRGKFLVLIMAGANRDPAVFADPDRFDITRPNAKEHISFGGGVHYCLGAALSRMEGEIGLRMLFERFPDLRATGTPTRRPARLLRGFAAMPVQLTARRISAPSRG